MNGWNLELQGARKALRNDNSWSDGKAAWVSMVIAVAFTLISIFVGIPLLKKMARRRFDRLVHI